MNPRRNIECVITHTRVAFSAQSLILSAIVSSLFSKKVCYSEITKSYGFLYLANMVLSPTAQINAFPSPAITLLSAKRKGSGFYLWLSGSPSSSFPKKYLEVSF